MSIDRSKVNIARVDGLEERLQEITQKLKTGLTVGQVIWSQSNRREDNPGCLPLFTGEHVSTSDYSGLHSFLLNNPANVTTKAIYDTLVANASVDCPYYAIDNDQIYLPILRNYLNTVYAADESGESGTELVVEKTNLYPWVCYILQVDDYITPIGYVKTSGDVMTGNLTIQKSAPAILLTNSNSKTFNIRANDVNDNLDIMTHTGIGIYLNSTAGYQPYYSDGSNAYRLLNTNDMLSVSIPVGSLAFGPVTTMNGYLLCNGQAVSRTDYSSLFAAIGTNFGAGDGSTTFNLPDYRGCFLRGLGGDSADSMYTKQAMGAPNITGTFSVVRKGGAENPGPTGAFTQTTWDAHNGSGGGDDFGGTYTLDASRYNSAYGAANEIRPVNFAVNIFIKY